jgi:4-amino-4-deoxy-L-arabinose transferase-like glycosyltransferase
VELTPASQRPYVGSSTNNSELGLTFGYNGFGRVGGQVGGPGHVPLRPGATVPFSKKALATIRRHQLAHRGSSAEFAGTSGSLLVNGRNRSPIPFGGPPGPLRLFGKGLGDQAGWLLPLAAFGLLALALLGFAEGSASGRRRPTDRRSAGAGPVTARSSSPEAGGRRDPRLATVVVLGGWFLVEAVVLSLSKGIVHPYYVSALAPGTGAMAGAGAVAFVALLGGRLRVWGLALLAGCLLATLGAEIVLLHRAHYMSWFVPVLLAGTACGFAALLLRGRLAAPAMALLFCLLLVAPAAYAATTWMAPVEGTFPAAGPKAAAGAGGVGVSGGHLQSYRELIRFVEVNGTGSRWALFTDAAPVAAPYILLGLNAGALAGYSGTDPALDGPGLARIVAAREARFVVLGGEFASRGGNRATAAVLRACQIVAPRLWHGPEISPYGLALFDCAGRERALASS